MQHLSQGPWHVFPLDVEVPSWLLVRNRNDRMHYRCRSSSHILNAELHWLLSENLEHPLHDQIRVHDRPSIAGHLGHFDMRLREDLDKFHPCFVGERLPVIYDSVAVLLDQGDGSGASHDVGIDMEEALLSLNPYGLSYGPLSGVGIVPTEAYGVEAVALVGKKKELKDLLDGESFDLGKECSCGFAFKELDDALVDSLAFFTLGPLIWCNGG